MYVLVLIVALMFFSSTSGLFGKGSKDGVSPLDIKEFYKGRGPIWTLRGTSGDAKITCKVDRKKKIRNKELTFLRMFLKGTEKRFETLTGLFDEYDANNHPTAMSLKSKESGVAIYEKVLYQDDKYTCGVFLLTVEKSSGRKKSICELRVRSKKRPPEATKDCKYAFEVKCQRPYKQLYEDSCPKK